MKGLPPPSEFVLLFSTLGSFILFHVILPKGSKRYSNENFLLHRGHGKMLVIDKGNIKDKRHFLVMEAKTLRQPDIWEKGTLKSWSFSSDTMRSISWNASFNHLNPSSALLILSKVLMALNLSFLIYKMRTMLHIPWADFRTKRDSIWSITFVYRKLQNVTFIIVICYYLWSIQTEDYSVRSIPIQAEMSSSLQLTRSIQVLIFN